MKVLELLSSAMINFPRAVKGILELKKYTSMQEYLIERIIDFFKNADNIVDNHINSTPNLNSFFTFLALKTHAYKKT